MICNYCHSQNQADDHRCGRCGRRLNDNGSRRQTGIPFQPGAAAPQLQPAEAPAASPASGPQLVNSPVPDAQATPREAGPSIQASLFGPQEVHRTAHEQGRAVPHKPAQRRRALENHQQSFPFDAVADQAPRRREKATAAPPGDRTFAALVDMAIPLAGFAVALAAFRAVTGTFPSGRQAQAFYAAAALLSIGFYRVLCCAGNRDTPGIQCAGLRIQDADGRSPGRRARFYRLAGGVISLLSLGIGLVWSLLDEDHLTWHDHMSGTFPVRRMY